MRHKWTLGFGHPVWSRRCLREECGLEHRVTWDAGPNGGSLTEYRRRGGEWRRPEGDKAPPCDGRPSPRAGVAS